MADTMAIFEFNKPETFQPAIDKAWDDLVVVNPEEVVVKATVQFEFEKKIYKVPVLGQEYIVELENNRIQHPEGMDEHIRGALTVLVLHYLVSSKAKTLRNKLISYRELPNGMVFYNAFRCNRCGIKGLG